MIINGEILRALLISGIVIGMMMVVGIHPVTGTPSDQIFAQGELRGSKDCALHYPYNPKQGPNTEGNDTDYRDGYNYGWTVKGRCDVPPS
jgi:hypothetical protein